MRARSVISSTALLLAGAGSVAGCALVYGYGDYHAGTTSGGAGGSGTAGAMSSGGANGGAGTAGGGGTAGSGGAGCSSSTSGEPYVVEWSTVYGNGKPASVVGVHLGKSGIVTLGGNIQGKVTVGNQKPDAGPKQGMLVAQFDGKHAGAPLFAKAFSGSGDVTATALAVDSDDNVAAVASFSGSMNVVTPMWSTVNAASTDSAIVALGASSGVLDQSSSHQLHCTFNVPLTKCSTTVASAAFFGSDLYLAGSFLGNANFDTMNAVNVYSMDVDGFGAIYGTAAYQLAGTGDGEAGTAFVPTSDGEFVIGATVSDATTLKQQTPPGTTICPGDSNNSKDIYVEKIHANRLSDWTCGDALQSVAGNQELDAIVPMTLDIGAIFMAGRTDGDAMYQMMGFNAATPGIFLGSVEHDNTVNWVKPFQVSASSPVHLEVSPDDSHLLVSGTFTGLLPTEDQGPTVMSNGGENGFVAIFDATGKQTWGRALVPCDGADGPTSLIASWYDEKTIAIAGTVGGAAQFAGHRIGSPHQPAFFVAELGNQGN